MNPDHLPYGRSRGPSRTLPDPRDVLARAHSALHEVVKRVPEMGDVESATAVSGALARALHLPVDAPASDIARKIAEVLRG